MKLTLHNETGVNLVRAYEAGRLELANRVITGPVLMSPDQPVLDWRFDSIGELVEADLEPLLAWRPDIVVLGTGQTQHFPPPALIAALARRAIGLEVMTTAAACRTFNVLAVDGRNVAAALVV